MEKRMTGNKVKKKELSKQKHATKPIRDAETFKPVLSGNTSSDAEFDWLVQAAQKKPRILSPEKLLQIKARREAKKKLYDKLVYPKTYERPIFYFVN